MVTILETQTEITATLCCNSIFASLSRILMEFNIQGIFIFDTCPVNILKYVAFLPKIGIYAIALKIALG